METNQAAVRWFGGVQPEVLGDNPLREVERLFAVYMEGVWQAHLVAKSTYTYWIEKGRAKKIQDSVKKDTLNMLRGHVYDGTEFDMEERIRWTIGSRGGVVDNQWLESYPTIGEPPHVSALWEERRKTSKQFATGSIPVYIDGELSYASQQAHDFFCGLLGLTRNDKTSRERALVKIGFRDLSQRQAGRIPHPLIETTNVVISVSSPSRNQVDMLTWHCVPATRLEVATITATIRYAGNLYTVSATETWEDRRVNKLLRWSISEIQ